MFSSMRACRRVRGAMPIPRRKQPLRLELVEVAEGRSRVSIEKLFDRALVEVHDVAQHHRAGLYRKISGPPKKNI